MSKPLSGHAKARKATAKHTASLLKRPGVHGTFTGEKITGGKKTGVTAIIVLVTEKKDVPKKERIPETLDGVPTDVREEQISIPSAEHEWYDPIQGGISINEVDLDPVDPVAGGFGTIGLVVTDNTTGELVALSNHHVLYFGGAVDGTEIYQPAYGYGGTDVVGHLGANIRGSVGDTIDAAICSIDHRKTLGSVVGIGDVTSFGAAEVDMSVTKHGVTSGTTVGTVEAIDATVTVAYPEPVGDTVLTDMIRIAGSPFQRPGDSGSAVISDEMIVGLVVSSDPDGTIGYSCKITNVFTELDLSLWTEPDGLILTGSEVKGHADIVTIFPNLDDTSIPDSWAVWGLFKFTSNDSAVSFGVGDPSAPTEYPAFFVTFAAPTAPGSGVAFTLTDPSGSVNIGSQSFAKHSKISFALDWDATTGILSCEARQSGHPTAEGSLELAGSPSLSLPYNVIVAGERDGGGEIATIQKLQAGRDCGDIPEFDGVFVPGDWTTEYGISFNSGEGQVTFTDEADALARLDITDVFPRDAPARLQWTGSVTVGTTDGVFLHFALSGPTLGSGPAAYIEILFDSTGGDIVSAQGFGSGFDSSAPGDLGGVIAFDIDFNPGTNTLSATVGGVGVTCDLDWDTETDIQPTLDHGSALVLDSLVIGSMEMEVTL